MHILPNGDVAANQSDDMVGHTVNVNEARMMVKGQDGEWITLAGAADDHFTVGDQTSFMSKMVVTMCLFTRLAIALRKLGHHQVRVRPTVMLG